MATTGILIPVLNKGDSLREANFRHVLSVIQRQGLGEALVVAQQVGGNSTDSADTVKKLVPDATVLTFDSEDSLIHKSRLVNMATEEHRRKGYDYSLMIDADIHCDIRQIVLQLNALDPKVTPVVKPLRFFVRLSLKDSAKVRSGEGVSACLDDYPRKEVIAYPGAGTFAYSMAAFDKVGGMDEAYVGWGWEDTDFSMRLRKALPWKTLPTVGFHLEHENDRVINQKNFDMFKGEVGGDKDWNKMSVHVTNKVCLFSYGRCGSTLLALGLHEHPDINFFSAKSKDLKVKGCTELFAAEHFRSKFPKKWKPALLVKYLGKYLTGTESNSIAGFKLMCGQPSHEEFPFIFDYIKDKQNRFTTIHVYRRDLLEQLCSFFVARDSSKWMKSYGKFTTKISLTELKAKAKENLTFASAVIEGCPNTLHVAYEDLVGDWEETMRKVQTYLSLRPLTLNQMTKRQRKKGENWQKFVTNYEEVRESFVVFEDELKEEFPLYYDIIEKI